MRHYGKTSFRNILHNLPDDCRTRMELLESSGWNCSFYLSVLAGTMHYAMAAEKGSAQKVVCATEIEAVVAMLHAKICGASGRRLE